MAVVHTSGTQLETKLKPSSQHKAFLWMIGLMYLVAMHFFMPNPGGAGLALSFNPTTWMTLTVAFAFGLFHIGSWGFIKYSKLTIGLLVSCVLFTIPTFYPASVPELAVTRLLGLWAGFVLFLLLQQFPFSNKQKQRLLWFVLIAAFVEAIFGHVQFWLLEPNNPFGYNTVINRPYGIFQQPNVMASFMATGLVLSGYLLAKQPLKYQVKKQILALLYLMPLLSSVLLVVLASRTGWLGLALSVLLISPYLYKRCQRARLGIWGLSLLTGLFIGILASMWPAESYKDKDSIIESKATLQDVRSYIYPQALDMYIEKPFSGYGYGKFESEYIVYTANQHQLNSDYKPGLPSMNHPHNEILFWAVEGGILPVLGIFIAALLVLSRIITDKAGTRMASLSLFVPLLLHSQLEYPFYHSAIHWITLIILLYWVDQRVAKYKKVRITAISQFSLRIGSVFVPLITGFIMLTALHSNYVLSQYEQSNPRDANILHKVTNPIVWQDRYDWNIYSSYLNIGLYTQNDELIMPFISWAQEIIKEKPRPAFYQNLILAYQAIGEHDKAEQIRDEARFLFPNLKGIEQLHYQAPSRASDSLSTQSSGVPISIARQ